jgi:catechol 2,3-dioxygenase-like lactoylglutathione lyase family enzyme
MTIERMDHVGIVVEDLVAATEFFAALGMERGGSGEVEGGWVDRIVGLEGVRSELTFMRTADGHGQVELVKFHSPPSPDGEPEPPSNALGIRHLSLVVDDVDATVAKLRARGTELVGEVEDAGSYRLCYVRGPEGIIVELAQSIG